jgi:MoaA/NifB/PqqE/SkfB family radical SAM enzyme
MDIGRKGKQMGWGLYCKLIDEIAEKYKHTRVWLIFFGEPTLLNDMPGRIAYAKSKGLADVVLNSNGVELNKVIAKRYIDAGLDAIYIGIDAVKLATYKAIRVGGDYHKVVNNILTYRNMLKNTKQKIYVQFVECDENRAEKNEFIQFWKKNNVPVKIRPKVTWAGLIEPDKTTLRDDRIPCRWFMTSMSICSDGRVALCPCDVHCRKCVGNVAKNTIKEVWEEWRETRTFVAAGRFDKAPKMCHTCTDWATARSEIV